MLEGQLLVLTAPFHCVKKAAPNRVELFAVAGFKRLKAPPHNPLRQIPPEKLLEFICWAVPHVNQKLVARIMISLHRGGFTDGHALLVPNFGVRRVVALKSMTHRSCLPIVLFAL